MSVTVNITKVGRVGRWEPDSRGRLQEAALELYAERGFDQTTAAQIAARAGLTERTFFRHFADKREVLFGGSAVLQEQIVRGVEEAPAGDSALDAVGRGLQAAASLLGQSRRDLTAKRQEVIAANPELRERELSKLADYAATMAAALGRRGVKSQHATLAAEAGMTVLRVALEQWVSDDRELTAIIEDSLAQLRAVAAGTG
jgi:AcrR family transcriptional regulator